MAQMQAVNPLLATASPALNESGDALELASPTEGTAGTVTLLSGKLSFTYRGNDAHAKSVQARRKKVLNEQAYKQIVKPANQSSQRSGTRTCHRCGQRWIPPLRKGAAVHSARSCKAEYYVTTHKKLPPKQPTAGKAKKKQKKQKTS